MLIIHVDKKHIKTKISLIDRNYILNIVDVLTDNYKPFLAIYLENDTKNNEPMYFNCESAFFNVNNAFGWSKSKVNMNDLIEYLNLKNDNGMKNKLLMINKEEFSKFLNYILKIYKYDPERIHLDSLYRFASLIQ